MKATRLLFIFIISLVLVSCESKGNNDEPDYSSAKIFKTEYLATPGSTISILGEGLDGLAWSSSDEGVATASGSTIKTYRSGHAVLKSSDRSLPTITVVVEDNIYPPFPEPKVLWQNATTNDVLSAEGEDCTISVEEDENLMSIAYLKHGDTPSMIVYVFKYSTKELIAVSSQFGLVEKEKEIAASLASKYSLISEASSPGATSSYFYVRYVNDKKDKINLAVFYNVMQSGSTIIYYVDEDELKNIEF